MLAAPASEYRVIRVSIAAQDEAPFTRHKFYLEQVHEQYEQRKIAFQKKTFKEGKENG